MQKILKWFTPLLAIGVAVFLVFFLISINSLEEFIDKEPLALKTQVIKKKPEKVWLDHFSKSQRLGYFYPVNEVYIKVDLDEIVDLANGSMRNAISILQQKAIAKTKEKDIIEELLKV